MFEFTGGVQSYTVPAGITELKVKVWGAGGAGRTGSYDNYSGGSGGFTTTKLSVTPGETISVIVGEGGKHGTQRGGDGGWPAGGFGTLGDASGGGGGGLGGSIRTAHALEPGRTFSSSRSCLQAEAFGQTAC